MKGTSFARTTLIVVSALAVSDTDAKAQVPGPDLQICRAPFERDALRVEYKGLTWGTFKRDTLEVICSARNEQQLRSVMGTLQTIVPGGFDVPLGISGKSEAEQKKWENDCRQKYDAVSEESLDRVALSVSTNMDANAAFNQCIRDVRGGFHVWAEPALEQVALGDPLSIHFRWAPTIPVGPLRIDTMLTNGAKCEPFRRLLQPQEDVVATCTRTRTSRIQVDVNTTPGFGASVRLPAIFTPPPPQVPPPVPCQVVFGVGDFAPQATNECSMVPDVLRNPPSGESFTHGSSVASLKCTLPKGQHIVRLGARVRMLRPGRNVRGNCWCNQPWDVSLKLSRTDMSSTTTLQHYSESAQDPSDASCRSGPNFGDNFLVDVGESGNLSLSLTVEKCQRGEDTACVFLADSFIKVE